MSNKAQAPDWGKCEVCGAAATNLVRDVKRIIPPGGWIESEPDGEVHPFCDIHIRESRLRIVFADLKERG